MCVLCTRVCVSEYTYMWSGLSELVSVGTRGGWALIFPCPHHSSETDSFLTELFL